MRVLVALTTLVSMLTAPLGACRKYDGDEHKEGATGQELFSFYCARCHGPDGAGNFLAGVPSNRSTALRKEEIVKLIRKGMVQHERMRTFPKLTAKEAYAIAEYLEVLKEQAGEDPFWKVPPVPSAGR